MRRTTILSATALVFTCVFFLAPLAAQAALYAPGATLDPGCPPTDITTCGIATSTQVTVSMLSATTTLPGITTLPSLSLPTSQLSGILSVANGGTGLSAIQSGFIPFGNGTGALATSSALYFDATNGFLGIGTTSPFTNLSVAGNGYFSGSINVGDPATTRSNLGLVYASSADIHGAENKLNIATWGDSLTYGFGGSGTTYVASLSMLSGYSVYNGGVLAETSTKIAARMLAATDKYSWPTIIWAGFNNRTDPTTIKANIASMVAALASVGNNDYLILAILNSSNETIGTNQYNVTTTLNSDLASIYGSHYLDVRSHLVSLYNPGNPQDVADHTNDIPPSSLRSDTVHLNDTGYSAVANYIYENFHIIPNVDDHVLTSRDIISLLNPGGGYRQGGVTVLVGSTTNYNLLVGQYAGDMLISGSSQNTVVGYEALTTATSSNNNTAVGFRALYSNTSGSNNTAIGDASLFFNTTGLSNSALSNSALYSNISGSYNVALGEETLYYATSTSSNTAVGYQALRMSSSATAKNSGTYNSALGYQALFSNTTGSNNTALGRSSLNLNTTGGNNTAVGYKAFSSNISGGSNSVFGYLAGYGDGTSADNQSIVDSNMTLIGTYASRDAFIASTTALSKGVAIGYNAKVGGSNMMALGGIGADAVKVGIGTSTPYAKLSIAQLGTDTNKTVFAISSSTAAYATTTLFSIANTGDVTINGSSGSTCVIGNGTSGTSCSSDAALKNVIGPIPNALAGIEGITGIRFNWKDPTKPQATYIGVLAQDVQKYFPEAVSMGPNGYLSVDYASLVAPLIEAVKELAHKVDALAVSITTAVLNATTGNFTNVNSAVDSTQKLCVGSTCVTEFQLKAMLQNSGQQSAAAPETPASDTTVEPVPDETTVETPPEPLAPAAEPVVEQSDAPADSGNSPQVVEPAPAQ